MRKEREMFDLILNVANKDERIRAVYMNGSRTNPNVPKDIFQDYDIVYVVKDIKSFIEDKNWIDMFGKRLFMQLPDECDKIVGHEIDIENRYAYLIQFADGNRIDLSLQTIDFTLKTIKDDKLTIILLDKDNALPDIPKATDRDYWVKKPTQELFSVCCNEFWWLQNNVAKGLWREEIPYVMDMINMYIRPELVQIMSWYVGVKTNFNCSVGKSGKYLNEYLSKDIYDRFLKTYPCAEINKIWESEFIMCELFKDLALKVAKSLGFKYNAEEGENSFNYLKHVSELPKDAEEVL